MENMNKRSIRGVVDRFEGDHAVMYIENAEGETFDLPRSILPEAVKEGTIVDISIKAKQNKTQEAKKAVQEMINKLKMKN
jgi:hypothetical protein